MVSAGMGVEQLDGQAVGLAGGVHFPPAREPITWGLGPTRKRTVGGR